MGEENLQELVERQTEITKLQAEAIKTFETRIAELECQAVELKATIARLQKDSRNSSKPSSLDGDKEKRMPGLCRVR
jgi:hypothetical protein